MSLLVSLIAKVEEIYFFFFGQQTKSFCDHNQSKTMNNLQTYELVIEFRRTPDMVFEGMTISEQLEGLPLA